MKMSESRYLTKIAREDINGGEYLRALIQIATDLESLFFDKLFFEKGINPDLIENWTLGRLTDWVIKNQLVEEKYFDLLLDFKEVRNAVAHHRYGMYNATNDILRLNFLARLMLKVCDFIDATPVIRKHNEGYEEKYQKIMEKAHKKYEKAFSEDKIQKMFPDKSK